MKKTKLIGARILDNVKYPRIPNIILFTQDDDINNASIEEGDLLDAKSALNYMRRAKTHSKFCVQFNDYATKYTSGVVKIGDNINLTDDGKISVDSISIDFINNLK